MELIFSVMFLIVIFVLYAGVVTLLWDFFFDVKGADSILLGWFASWRRIVLLWLPARVFFMSAYVGEMRFSEASLRLPGYYIIAHVLPWMGVLI